MPRRYRLWLGWLACLLPLPALAQAQLPGCGLWRDQLTRLEMEVRHPEQAIEFQRNRQGERINVFHWLLGDGLMMGRGIGPSPIQFSVDGRQWLLSKGPAKDYQLVEAAECGAPELPPPGTCRNDLTACVARLEDAQVSAEDELAACAEGVEFACRRWFERKQVGEQLYPALLSNPFSRRDDVQQAIKRITDPPALDAAALDQVAAMCQPHSTPSLCIEVGNVLWRGYRFIDAATLWQRHCGQSRDSIVPLCFETHERAAAQAQTLTPALQPQRPCGLYRGQNWDLDFDGQHSAQFNDGERHDFVFDGADIVFPSLLDLRLRPLANGRLAGLNGLLLHDVLEPTRHCDARQK